MFKVNLICVGRIREKYLADACAEYAKRLSRFCRLCVLELPESTLSREPSEGEREKLVGREGEAILRACEGEVILFDLKGQQLTSERFSGRVLSARDGGRTLSLVVGGSYGVSSAVRERADLLLSVSEMTFPHMLFRVMALEQLYRAFMIGAGSDYHK